MEKLFPFIEECREQPWGKQFGVEIACPVCGEKRFIGRTKYKEKFRKGHKCGICDKEMIPMFVCHKCKNRLTSDLKDNSIVVRTL
ncbi:MAG: hypothetical protein AABZ57_05100 [Candidatus Margulisiibacteriota bacterium]